MSTPSAERLVYNDIRYSGTRLRVLAALIDVVVAGTAELLFFGAAVFYLLGSADYLAKHIPYATMLTVGAVIVSDFIFALYYGACESSPVQATPGKALLGLKVERADGERYTLWGAMGRYILQMMLAVVFTMVAAITLFIPVLALEAVTCEMSMLKQVCGLITLFLTFVFVFVPVENNKIQSICDRVLGRRVVKS